MASKQDDQVGGAYVDAGGVHTYYEVVGHGDPVVLLHGASPRSRRGERRHRRWPSAPD